MRSMSRSETTCSSCSASSCTSAQLMPITCTRNELDQAMTPQHQPGELFAGGVSRTPLYGSYSASPDSASAFTIVVAVPGVTPRAARDLSHRHEPRVAPAARLALVDGLEVVLDRARREHATILSLFAAMSRARDQRIATPEASAATSARCSRPSRTATISSPSRCRTGRIGGGSGGWSSWPRLTPGTRGAGSGDRHRRHRVRARDALRAVVGLDITRADDRTGAGEGDQAQRRDGPRFWSATCWRCRFRRRDLRSGDDRIRSAKRAGSAARDRRDPPGAEAGRPGSVARFRPSVHAGRARGVSAVSRDRGRHVRLDRCIAIRTPIATFRRRFAAIRAPTAWRRLMGARGFARVRALPVLGGLMAIHHAY